MLGTPSGVGRAAPIAATTAAAPTSLVDIDPPSAQPQGRQLEWPSILGGGVGRRWQVAQRHVRGRAPPKLLSDDLRASDAERQLEAAS